MNRVAMLASLMRLPQSVLAAPRSDEDGQAMVEYALILFLVALVAIAIVGVLGTTVSSMFSTVVSEF